METAVKNVTITMDQATLQWLRRLAVERHMSLSSLVGDLLRERMLGDQRYELAMRRYVSLEPRPLGAKGQEYATREALHDRSRLR
ncbi:MAG: CopG family transcriptional regulator [Gammaproteobacteria bacterium]|nr:CopG family transcriptional regulator [Gammaproteobacteria bacterium]